MCPDAVPDSHSGVLLIFSFAAGIVLSAVSCELVPILNAAPNTLGAIGGIAGGFSIGIVLFLVLNAVLPEDEDEDADESGEYEEKNDTKLIGNHTDDDDALINDVGLAPGDDADGRRTPGLRLRGKSKIAQMLSSPSYQT